MILIIKTLGSGFKYSTFDYCEYKVDKMVCSVYVCVCVWGGGHKLFVTCLGGVGGVEIIHGETGVEGSQKLFFADSNENIGDSSPHDLIVNDSSLSMLLLT